MSARRTALAALTAGLLGLTLAPGASGAAPLAAGGAGATAEPVRVAVVPDPRGDAERRVQQRARPYLRLADLTRVRYRTPEERGGDLRIKARWNHLGDASEPGVRRQKIDVLVYGTAARDVIAIRVTNFSDRVRISFPTSPDGESIEPESATVERSFGEDGTMTAVLSTEWLADRRRVSFAATGSAGDAVDSTARTPNLAVGPRG